MSGFDISIPGLFLRLLIPLILFKVYHNSVYLKKRVFNKKLVHLLVFAFFGIIVSKIFAQTYYPNLSSTNLVYVTNAIKFITRFFVIAFALGSVMYKQKYRVRFIQVLLVTGFFLVIEKQFDIFGEYSTTEVSGAFGYEIEYIYESYGAMDKNYFSILLGINIILAMGYYSLTKNFLTRYVFLPVIIILSSIQLALTLSLGGIISSFGGIGILLYYHGKSKKRYYFVFPIVALFLIIISESAFMQSLILRLIGSYTSILPAFSGGGFSLNELTYFKAGSSLASRIGSTFYALNLFQESPLFGFGGYKDLTFPLFNTGTHTTYVAWMVHFGLITVIPLFLYIFKVLSITRRRILSARINNKTDEYNIQVIYFSILILLCIDGLASPHMLHIIAFMGIALFNNKKFSMFTSPPRSPDTPITH